MEPTEIINPPAPHPLRAAAGPLTAALNLARLYPQLPATIVEARNGVLAVFLHDADADTFDAWVRELGLEEWPPSEYEYRGETHWKLKAVGRYAEVQVEVSAYPAPQRGSAVAA